MGLLKCGWKDGMSSKRTVRQLRIGPKLGRMEIVKCRARYRLSFLRNVSLSKDEKTRDGSKKVKYGSKDGRCFMDKTFNGTFIILDKIANHNHVWHGGDQRGGINMGTPSLSHLVKENQERY
ncbi:hypothetical protein HAX54_050229 [Datura stramonium]|uniref:FAR1 domain-containing protein n=1 Tax=Datura stramonium TaxID=4076 RepID=A0ABS8WNI5_DATST|nr:hypothetical protein [Datura stramonium]